MGLAASQARFLGITARKADCEYRSTELAQEKLDITKQIGDISNQYAQALNATKLMWSHDGLANDFGLSYSLLMLPSATNNYNPYMVTSPSGAIILNSEYAAAAKAAGISKAGGVGSQDSRDKFIAALGYQGLLTDETSRAITQFDYSVNDVESKAQGKIVFNETYETGADQVSWNPLAGMGGEPMVKGGTAEIMTITDLSLSSIGQAKIDWIKSICEAGEVSKMEKEAEEARYDELIKNAKSGSINNDVISQLQRDLNKCIENEPDNLKEQERLENLIEQAKCYYNDINGVNLVYKDGKQLTDTNGKLLTKSDALENISNQLLADKTDYSATVTEKKLTEAIETTSKTIGAKLSVVNGGIVVTDQDELEDMTISDVLNRDIVLISDQENEDFRKEVLNLFTSMLKSFGYSGTDNLYGQGLYVDDVANEAMDFAYKMIEDTYLRVGSSVNIGVNTSGSMQENAAHKGAIGYNRIAIGNNLKFNFSTGKIESAKLVENPGFNVEKQGHVAVSLTNMLKSFLTYYDNYLNGADSQYVVGNSVETSVYVTDDPNYSYIVQDNTNVVSENDEKLADFFDQLYNNILEHGWREDAAIEDSEYLEATLKDGRYSMKSLNEDGYYYQSRYNETGYIVEVSDTDAIERAEAEFSSKKAELTYKEDAIDLKTKKVDAELSALTTEYDTVKNLISKTIEKTFAMFQN